MGIFNKFFGNQNKAAEADLEPGEVISLFDAQGREFHVRRSEYRRSMLPQKFKEVGDDPEALSGLIVMTLQDGFYEDCIEPAKKLLRIEGNSDRSVNIYGIMLLKNHRLSEAKKVLQDHLDLHGPSGVILNNLAKVLSEEGHIEASRKTLWQSLMIDPNQENALDWWAAINREENGEDGFWAAIDKVAEIEGSWRPQVWQARRLLEQKKVDSAIKIYRDVLTRFDGAHDVPMMITGDLGNSGYAIQMLDLFLPIYDPEKFGVLAGINLAQACIQIGEFEKGLELCNSIDRSGRPDIKQFIQQLRERLQANANGERDARG